jgi:hypothetical protein
MAALSRALFINMFTARKSLNAEAAFSAENHL